jgi:hypothetical protein
MHLPKGFWDALELRNGDPSLEEKDYALGEEK